MEYNILDMYFEIILFFIYHYTPSPRPTTKAGLFQDLYFKCDDVFISKIISKCDFQSSLVTDDNKFVNIVLKIEIVCSMNALYILSFCEIYWDDFQIGFFWTTFLTWRAGQLQATATAPKLILL